MWRVASQGSRNYGLQISRSGERETESTGVRVIAIHSQFVTHSVNKDMNLSKLQVMGGTERPAAAARGVEKKQTEGNWTKTTIYLTIFQWYVWAW